MEEKLPPVNEGDVLKLPVDMVGKGGDPIMKIKGFVIFLKNTKEFEVGKMIEIRITKVTPKFAFAERNDEKGVQSNG